MLNFKEWFSHHHEDNVQIGGGTPKYYTNPYLVGLLLGLVLLSAFVIMGRGLGASGALSTTVAVVVHTLSPDETANNDFYEGYIGDGTTNPFKSWLVFEVLGVVIGGFISGAIAGRNKIMVEKGPRISNKGRFLFAFIGGALMGFGAKLGRGCTSGQALSGGAVLSVGGWAFMAAIFVGAYAFAYIMRRQWI